MKRLAAIVTVVAATLFTASLSHATLLTFSTGLSGPAESPPNASPGTGFGIVRIDTVTQFMNVVINFSGLLANTTASHIHCCTAVPGTGVVGVATVTPSFTGFPLGVTSGTYDHTFDMNNAASYNPAFVAAHGGTAAGAFAFLLNGIVLGDAYLNVHTTSFPGGEIRGFLPVPEPASLALLAAGLLAVGWLRRRQLR